MIDYVSLTQLSAGTSDPTYWTWKFTRGFGRLTALRQTLTGRINLVLLVAVPDAQVVRFDDNSVFQNGNTAA